MKILVTGATGLLGRAVMRKLHTSPYTVVGTGFSRAGGDIERLDLCDSSILEATIARLAPDVIIHTAAERRPDVSEADPDGTLQLNVEATRHLAHLAGEHGTWLIYLSTDYVFDGTTPPYVPDDAANPLNFYGRSKRDGELAIWSELQDACVLRVPILYGPVETLEESPVTVIARDMLAARGTPRALTMDAWAIRYPTLVDDVAAVLQDMLEQRLANPGFGGTLHWSGDEALTKYDMALAMAPLTGLDPQRLMPDPHPPAGAPRPRDSHLDCTILDDLGLGHRTPFREAIAQLLPPHLH